MPTLLFDFDGTIAQTLPLLVKIFNQAAPEYHLPTLTPEKVEELRGLSARELLQRYPLPPWQLLRLARYLQRELHLHLAELTIVPGMNTLFAELAATGANVGIVTSNTVEIVSSFLERNHVTTITSITSEKNIFGKGQVIKKLITQQQLNPREVWYIGDEVRDVEAAQQAGIKSVAVSWGFNNEQRLENAQPDFLANTVEILGQILEHK